MLVLIAIEACNPVTLLPEELSTLDSHLQLVLGSNDMIKIVEREIEKLDIPPMTITAVGFEITISEVSIDAFDSSAISIDIQDGKVELAVKNQAISISAKLAIKQKSFPYIKDYGHAYIDVMTELAQMTISNVESSCKYHVNLKTSDQKVAVSDIQIKIKSTFSPFLQPFMNIIEGKVLEFLNGEQIENLLNNIDEPINNALNGLLPLTFTGAETIDSRIVNYDNIFQNGKIVIQMLAQFCHYNKDENICQNKKIQENVVPYKDALLALSLESFNSGLKMIGDDVITSIYLTNLQQLKVIYTNGETEELAGQILVQHDGVNLKFYFNLEIENEQIQNICNTFGQVFPFDFAFTEFTLDIVGNWLYINGVE